MVSRGDSTEVVAPTADLAAPPDDAAAWLAALRGGGADYERAVGELHELLLRAARFTVRRALEQRTHLREAFDDLAQQSADDALVKVLAKLDTFRGESRFTTWAYKFAVLEASVALRRHAWQAREIPLEDDGWRSLHAGERSPGEQVEARELLDAVRAAIETELTAHQRRVLVAVTLGDVPIDVLAERLGTSRGALYKTLHDARRRLRVRLAADGFDLGRVDREEGR
ncbi:MAG: sigma-70 family RNA polymerase sigma factor [Conexibacter sp.]